MTEASRWRIDFARKLTPYYASHPAVEMIVLGGSPSRGLSDEYSDIDIIVFWNALDREWISSEPLCELSCTRVSVRIANEESGLESYMFGSLKADFGHLTIGAWEKMTRTVLADHDPNPDIQQSLGGFLASIPLHGEEEVAQWKDRIGAYPEPLAVAMVKQNLRLFVKGYLLNQCWRRGELLAWYDGTSLMLKRLLCILAGLNRRYFSGEEPRWVEHHLASWTIKPVNSWERMTAILTSGGEESDALMESLVEDVLELIEHHLPEVDIAWLSRREALGVTGCALPPPA